MRPDLLPYGDAVRLAPSGAVGGSPCKSPSFESPRASLEDRRESIERLLRDEEMSCATRPASVSSFGDRASPCCGEEDRRDGACVADCSFSGTAQFEPACVYQDGPEQTCLAIADNASSGRRGDQGDTVVVNAFHVRAGTQLDLGSVHNKLVPSKPNLLALTDAGEEIPVPSLEPSLDARLRMVLWGADACMIACPVEGQLEDHLQLTSGCRVSALEDVPHFGGLEDGFEDQKTPCRRSRAMHSSRGRPSNTPALPTPEYPSASRVESRCGSEVFNAASLAEARAAKPQRTAPKRGAHNAGLRAAKPRRRKVDSGGE